MKTARDIKMALVWISAMSAVAFGKELRARQNRMETIISNLFGARVHPTALSVLLKACGAPN
jgi:hypothetical protein